MRTEYPRADWHMPAVADGRLAEFLSTLTFRSDGTPDAASWKRFLAEVDHLYTTTHDPGRDARATAHSSFKNLFHISPIPVMEQDYTEVQRWMADLRRQGVTNIREYLGDDLEAIKEVVPKITIVSANPAAVRAVGGTIEQFLGPLDPVIVNEGSQPGWLAQLEAVWEGRPVAEASFRARTTDGLPYDAESIFAAPVVNGTPDFSRAVLTILDVTSHRDQERQMAREIEAKSAFLASVSHEIRTPLTAILGFARLLVQGKSADEAERQAMVESIAQQAQDVTDLVEDLLVAARADIGHLDVVSVLVDVDREIESTMSAGGTYTRNVTLDLQDGLPKAIGDPARIRQILRNLLTNAERYGGPEVICRTSTDAARVFIDVIDDGPGLPQSEWDRIFEPYRRAHESPGQPGSIGIGLAISRELAELMGASLDYYRDGAHSVFRIGLGLAKP